MKATISGVFEDLKFKIAETANRADSGQLIFWSEPSEIFNVRSSSTPETVDFTHPDTKLGKTPNMGTESNDLSFPRVTHSLPFLFIA